MPPVDSFNNQPPALGRGHPTYPHLIQVCRVTGTTTPGSGAGSGKTFYNAVVEQHDPSNMAPRDRESCYIQDLNNVGLVAGYYTARLVGNYGGLPLLEVCEFPNRTCLETIYETDARCESGILNVYRRTVDLSVIAGCIQAVRGPWSYFHNAGCCSCGSSGSGSGSGSGGSGSGTTNCCNLFTAPVSQICVQLSSSDCPCLNGKQFTLYYALDEDNQPYYASDPTAHTCGSGGVMSVGIIRPCQLQIAMSGGVDETINSFGSAALDLTNCSPLAGTATVTMVQTGVGVSMCSGTVVATIVICSGSGSGSGGSGSGSGSGSGGSGSGSGGGGCVTVCGCCVSNTWTLRIEDGGGGLCNCMVSDVSMTYDISLGFWIGSYSGCSQTVAIAATCSGGTWTVLLQCGTDSPKTINSLGFTCSPFLISFPTTSMFGSSCCSGSITLSGQP